MGARDQIELDVLSRFSSRVGVPREHVHAVLVGLAEDERRDRFGAVTMCGLLMQCQEALAADDPLRAQIEETLSIFASSVL